MPAPLFGIMGMASFVALFANVYKHGWHWGSVAVGTFLTAIVLSLAVPSRRRNGAWVVRYWIALVTVCSLGVYRFLL